VPCILVFRFHGVVANWVVFQEILNERVDQDILSRHIYLHGYFRVLVQTFLDSFLDDQLAVDEGVANTLFELRGVGLPLLDALLEQQVSA
jgi:hypothetical protein